MRIKRLIAKTSLIFLLILLSSPWVFAISCFERLLQHPGNVVLIILGAGVVIVVGFYLHVYLSRVREISRAKEAKVEVARRKENKQARERQIPYGPVEDVSLPLGKLVWKAAGGIYEKIPDRAIPAKKEFYIGRMEGSDLELNNSAVSRRHAKIRPERDGYILYDLVTPNGTLVNEKKIDRHVLRDGDEIKIANNIFIFQQEKRR